MNERERKKEELTKISNEAKQKADELLDHELQALFIATHIDLEKIRPNITDAETFNQIIQAIEEATLQNENLADLKTRLENLGGTVVTVSKEIVALLIGRTPIS